MAIVGSVLSTRLVGLKDPATIVAFGAGKQIETHLDLHIRAYPSIRQCTIVNRSDNARLSSLEREDTADEEIESFVSDASMIICATSSTSPLFPSHWVRDGTHIILIGSYTPRMREVDTSLVLRACDTSRGGILLVDSKEACAKEAGELIDAGIGPDGIIEMGEMIRKREEYPRAPTTFGGVTMFKSVGVGLQDVAIAYATVDKALAMNPPVGTIIGQYDLV
ncbi:NAD(P)-binding protein [Salix suchowensis]|nr:NAD(P)-binding protein [Salix suchowensis]